MYLPLWIEVRVSESMFGVFVREGDEQEELPDDLSQVALLQLPLPGDHSRRRKEDDESVSYITEHDGEEERERYDGEETRVDFLVRADAVGVHDGLETKGEFVGAVVSRRRAVRAEFLQDRRDGGPAFLLLFATHN